MDTKAPDTSRRPLLAGPKGVRHRHKAAKIKLENRGQISRASPRFFSSLSAPNRGLPNGYDLCVTSPAEWTNFFNRRS